MKKTLKITLILLANIIFLIGVLFCIEKTIYNREVKIYNKNNINNMPPNTFTYKTNYPSYMTNTSKYFTGENNIWTGRKPDGTEYKGKKPILLFGCSYGLGQYLDFNQTFSYKLAHTLKRPVFNRSIHGGGLVQMYLQTQQKNFYKEIEPTDDVIFIMIHDHYRRMFLEYHCMLDIYVLPQYKLKNGKLIYYDYNSKIKNFYRALYSRKLINHIQTEKYVYNDKNADKITTLAATYLIKTKKTLEKKWNRKINFTVIFYEPVDILYKDKLVQKLEANHFKTFSTKDLTNEDLMSTKYFMSENYHPNENAWNLLTPLIIEKMGF